MVLWRLAHASMILQVRTCLLDACQEEDRDMDLSVRGSSMGLDWAVLRETCFRRLKVDAV